MRALKLLTVSLGTFIACTGPASAAKVSVVTAADGSETVVYQAGPREVNAPFMDAGSGPFGLALPFVEYGATLRAGDGCTPGATIVCGYLSPAEVHLGDRNDVAYVNSQFNESTVYGDAGNDDVLAGGLNASAFGGDGDDTLRLAASSEVEGSGGAGNDRIAGGLGSAYDTFSGGSGNDLLVPSGSTASTATGGDGNDDIVASGRSVTVDGGGGNDVIVVTAAADGPQIAGGGGNDVVDLSATPGGTVDGGSGSEWIDVRQGADTAPDTVTCGSGLDTVWADAGDTVDSSCELRFDYDVAELPNVTYAKHRAADLRTHTADPAAIGE